jgi:hypothetical protein
VFSTIPLEHRNYLIFVDFLIFFLFPMRSLRNDIFYTHVQIERHRHKHIKRHQRLTQALWRTSHKHAHRRKL